MPVVSPAEPKPNINPWLIILLTAPVPLMILTFIGVKWYQERTDLTRTNRYFIQRQNTVLAYDAMEVSTGISDLLEKTAREVRLMSLLPRTLPAYSAFHAAQMSDYTQFYTEAEPPKTVPLPFFNNQMVISPNGEVLMHLKNGKVDKQLKTVADCQLKDLCDRDLLEASLKLKVGEQRYGRVMRYYRSEKEKEDNTNASLNLAYRGDNAVYVLGIDFLHLKDHLTTPAFPYEVKRNLLQSYANGNYIYIVDSEKNIIVHPKYWHEAGIDRETGTWRRPMKNDEDEGKFPLHIEKYQGDRLRDYFRRLITQSFTQKGVDIFKAPNLGGVMRVISVAPIFVSKGQFAETGVFGHIVIGCSVEYFEEPTEQLVPYY